MAQSRRPGIVYEEAVRRAQRHRFLAVMCGSLAWMSCAKWHHATNSNATGSASLRARAGEIDLEIDTCQHVHGGARF